MALALLYDNVLSRVRISGTALSVVDSFIRSVGNGWGSATTGQVWTTLGGVAANYSVDGARGVITLPTGDVGSRNVLLPDIYGYVDVRTTVRFSAVATGGPLNAYVQARYQDNNENYRLQLRAELGGTIDVFLLRVVGGAESTLDSANAVATYTPGSDVHLRLQADGFTLRAKVWTGGLEPVPWTLDAQDPTSAHPLGQVGVRAQLSDDNTNVNPTISVDNLTVDPLVQVERSTDQIRWTTVRGGAGIAPSAGTITLDDYEFAAGILNWYRVLGIGAPASITPAMGEVWLKSLARPFLNRTVTVVDWSDVERASRSGVFPIVGRSFPVAVTDLHSSRRWTLDVVATTEQEASDLDLLISTGEVQFVHVPLGCRIPSGYVALGDTTERRARPRANRRFFSLPLTEVVAPGPDVIPAVGTWQTVLNTYPTWADVIAAHATWADLLQLVGSPGDVVVP